MIRCLAEVQGDFVAVENWYEADSLLDAAIRRAGRRPGHLITDHGAQFTAPAFERRLQRLGIRHRLGAVDSSKSIALIERLWRSLKEECSVAWLLFSSIEAIESRLQAWADWHRLHRPHQGLGGRTPEEVANGVKRRRRRAIPADSRWELIREDFAGQPWLPVYHLRRVA